MYVSFASQCVIMVKSGAEKSQFYSLNWSFFESVSEIKDFRGHFKGNENIIKLDFGREW